MGMKDGRKKNWFEKNWKKVLLFAITALLIDYFFPREGKFRYQFHEGKPWRYALLTAPTDFPIYKTDAEIKRARDSVEAAFEPYYRLDAAVESRELEALEEAAKGNPKFSPPYLRYVERSLRNLYKNGILSHEEEERLRTEGRSRIKVVQNNVAQVCFVSDLFTVRTAYEFLINNLPIHLNADSLRACNLDGFLEENLSYDSLMSDKVQAEQIQDIPISNGMVQAGERIVDRGEIVNSRTFSVLRSLQMVHEAKTGGTKEKLVMLAGQSLLVFGLIFCFYLYLYLFRQKRVNGRALERKDTVFLLLCILCFCLLTEFCVRYHWFNVYILPYAMVPIMVSTFLDSRTAMFTHLTTVLLCSFVVPYPYEFLVLETLAGIVAVFSIKELTERKQLVWCGIFIYLAYALSYASLMVYMETDLSKFNWQMFLYFGINAILLMFTYVLLAVLERVFGYISNVTLMELSNINNPLLMELAQKAPGTFQHSMQVSVLAMAAVEEIGGKALLVRTGALYHDIGKMENSSFFTENKGNAKGQGSPEDPNSLEKSAETIISHVKKGMERAKKYALPQPIINFICTHHGKGRAEYFYTKYRNKYPDQPVNEAAFTYPGPNPSSKEEAVLMLADSVEATSRSMTEHSEEAYKAMVDEIVDGKVNKGLLKDARLTFNDLGLVKQSFVSTLIMQNHTRISYPKEAGPKAEGGEGSR
ncbi:MAG: HDIG domain-containing protein [Tannerella sp.]|jgi:putative nucleotidyltransferase with HDIG domain|nr:HDIG domain-containing protein [Tannerella sp.]